jgi:hypothetical protein
MEAAMSNSYWRTERLIVDAVDRRILQKPESWDGIVSIVTDPDLLVLAAMCIVGLLFSLVATSRCRVLLKRPRRSNNCSDASGNGVT